MHLETFLEHVQVKGGFRDKQTAMAATRATLETLSERLAAGIAGSVADPLPSEVNRMLRSHEEAVEDFTVEEFFRRVSRREKVALSDAVLHARVVMDVLRLALNEEQMNYVREQLPEEFHQLFANPSPTNIPDNNK